MGRGRELEFSMSLTSPGNPGHHHCAGKIRVVRLLIILNNAAPTYARSTGGNRYILYIYMNVCSRYVLYKLCTNDP